MHSNIHSVTRFVRLAAVGILAAALGACGGGGGGDSGGGSSSGSSSSETAGGAGAGGNNAPSLTGSPSANAQVGARYTVAPSAEDADGDMLAFSIQNLPRWAEFNTATGQLSGTPTAGDVGVYANIVITVSDGKAQQSLPEFSVTVDPAGSGAGVPAGNGVATLQWQPPQVGAETLKGYRVYYGTDEGTLTEMIDVPNAGVLMCVVENLGPGKYFFAITAVNAMGLESQMSNVLSKTI